MGAIYESKHPLVGQKIAGLRDVETGSAEFRRLVRSLSWLLAYEATADRPTETISVKTPLGLAEGSQLIEQVGIVPILRAGLGMADGVLDLLPEAEVWHVGLYRDEHTLKPMEYYNKLPKQPKMTLALLVDPMLATGGSAVHACELVKAAGVPTLRLITLIAAPEGIDFLHTRYPEVDIFVGAIDERLNDVGFIYPGLGDAGDRQFATGSHD